MIPGRRWDGHRKARRSDRISDPPGLRRSATATADRKRSLGGLPPVKVKTWALQRRCGVLSTASCRWSSRTHYHFRTEASILALLARLHTSQAVAAIWSLASLQRFSRLLAQNLLPRNSTEGRLWVLFHVATSTPHVRRSFVSVLGLLSSWWRPSFPGKQNVRARELVVCVWGTGFGDVASGLAESFSWSCSCGVGDGDEP